METECVKFISYNCISCEYVGYKHNFVAKILWTFRYFQGKLTSLNDKAKVIVFIKIFDILIYFGLANKENNFLFRKIGNPESFIIGINSITE